MPAAIRVLVPNAPPLYQWIESEVIRIGSSPDSDIQIEGLAPHAATVVFRDGDYLLINRSNASLSLAHREVTPGAEAVWLDRAELVLADNVSMALVRHQDPRPLRCEPGRQLPDFEAPDQQRMKVRRRRKDMTCFAIAVLAIFLTAYISNTPHTPSYQIEYNRAMQVMSESPPQVQAEFSNVCEWIRKAYSVEQRGDAMRARDTYLQARELLLQAAISEPPSELRSKLLDFVTSRIANM